MSVAKRFVSLASSVPAVVELLAPTTAATVATARKARSPKAKFGDAVATGNKVDLSAVAPPAPSSVIPLVVAATVANGNPASLAAATAPIATPAMQASADDAKLARAQQMLAMGFSEAYVMQIVYGIVPLTAATAKGAKTAKPSEVVDLALLAEPRKLTTGDKTIAEEGLAGAIVTMHDADGVCIGEFKLTVSERRKNPFLVGQITLPVELEGGQQFIAESLDRNGKPGDIWLPLTMRQR